ncbi:MAG: hypothetical protein KAF27_00055 [Porphyrobacter sp.]|nr:hypothetical protein [Porphyrobacter sp.]
MIRISPQTYRSLSARRIEMAVDEVGAQIRQSNPDLANRLPPDEFRSRVTAGVKASWQHDLELEFDVMMLCLMHVAFGADVLGLERFRWALDILTESPGLRDDRVFRINRQLEEMY